MDELRFWSHRAFKHAPLLRVLLCVGWAFLVENSTVSLEKGTPQLYPALCFSGVFGASFFSHPLLWFSYNKILEAAPGKTVEISCKCLLSRCACAAEIPSEESPTWQLASFSTADRLPPPSSSLRAKVSANRWLATTWVAFQRRFSRSFWGILV